MQLNSNETIDWNCNRIHITQQNQLAGVVLNGFCDCFYQLSWEFSGNFAVIIILRKFINIFQKNCVVFFICRGCMLLWNPTVEIFFGAKLLIGTKRVSSVRNCALKLFLCKILKSIVFTNKLLMVIEHFIFENAMINIWDKKIWEHFHSILWLCFSKYTLWFTVYSKMNSSDRKENWFFVDAVQNSCQKNAFHKVRYSIAIAILCPLWSKNQLLSWFF